MAPASCTPPTRSARSLEDAIEPLDVFVNPVDVKAQTSIPPTARLTSAAAKAIRRYIAAPGRQAQQAASESATTPRRGPHPTRESRTTAVTIGPASCQVTSWIRPPPPVATTTRRSLARKKSRNCRAASRRLIHVANGHPLLASPQFAR